jgi:hypothetical protein
MKVLVEVFECGSWLAIGFLGVLVARGTPNKLPVRLLELRRAHGHGSLLNATRVVPRGLAAAISVSPLMALLLQACSYKKPSPNTFASS